MKVPASCFAFELSRGTCVAVVGNRMLLERENPALIWLGNSLCSSPLLIIADSSLLGSEMSP